MTAVATKKIAIAALALPVRQRAALANSLLASLPPPKGSDDFDAELARRVEEVKSGKAKGRPAAAVMRDLHARYPQP